MSLIPAWRRRGNSLTACNAAPSAKSNHVTFACDDESILKHTNVFLNKNLIQCYHHNRGYAAFEMIADISILKTFVAKLFAEKNIVKKDIQWCVDKKKNVSFTKLAIVLSNMKD